MIKQKKIAKQEKSRRKTIAKQHKNSKKNSKIATNTATIPTKQQRQRNKSQTTKKAVKQ